MQKGEITEGEVARVIVDATEEHFGSVINGKHCLYKVRIQTRPKCPDHHARYAP
ncbi:MAG: hypothetical protein U1D30_06950 [Planctomycetota bacterium]